jgi:acyl-CoA synthetase (AMP-forming)/AMP-acid ligase II
LDLFGRTVGFVDQQLTALRVLTTSGVVRPYSPSVLHKIARSLLDWGFGPAGGFSALAARYPDRVGLVDELGELTFLQMHERSNALADALAARGVGPRNGVAIMCRNHRGFVDASVAAAKLGADVIYLNTAFAGPQLVEVLDREQPGIVVHDQEFGHLLVAAKHVDAVLAWCDTDPGDAETLEGLIGSGSAEDRTPPEKPSRIIILTSGTTGAPKGAPRSEAGVGDAVSLLSRLPLKAGWRTHIAAPLFHTWGWAHLALSMLLGTTMVLRRRFEPEDCLRAVTEERCDSLVVIPVMLQRIMQLPHDVRDRYDLSQVKVVAASGSALAGDLGIEWMDQFGDTLYNIYGSTEVAYATVATPADLRAAPGTAGKPPHATVVRILDERGDAVPRGESGRIFVGNGMLFEGYTGGGGKDTHDGLMASGDVGRFDENGRLFVEGRDDEMVVSGGENVFPKEVEDCLARHERVVEAACVGVDDADFGKRLRAYVVLTEPGAVTAEDLRSWVRSNLARYKVPRDVVFVDQLPRNATGKVVKRELPDVANPDAQAQPPRRA